MEWLQNSAPRLQDGDFDDENDDTDDEDEEEEDEEEGNEDEEEPWQAGRLA